MHKKLEFIQIIKENEGIIYKITRVYASDDEDQKDLYQEIVFQLWKSFDGFRNESKISTWIYRVALNTSITHSKKGKRKEHHIPVDFELLNSAEEKNSLMEERLETLYEHINRLNLIEKGIVLLFLEGKSYDEIAKITGFTTTNVGTRLGRIKQKLKTQINTT